MDKVRLALIGFGRWGRKYLQAAQDAGNAEVISIHNRYGGLQVADSPGYDAIIYAGHPRDATRVVQSTTIPMLCEKPAGLSVADAECIELATLNRVFLVGHQHLFAEPFERLLEKSKDSLIEGYSIFAGDGPTRDYSSLWDYGPHAVSTALALLGSVTTVLPINTNEFDIKSSLGTINCIVSSKIQNKYARVVTYRVTDFRRTEYDGYLAQEPPLTLQVRAFAEAVRAGGTDDWRFGGQWATRVARVLNAAER